MQHPDAWNRLEQRLEETTQVNAGNGDVASSWLQYREMSENQKKRELEFENLKKQKEEENQKKRELEIQKIRSKEEERERRRREEQMRLEEVERQGTQFVQEEHVDIQQFQDDSKW